MNSPVANFINAISQYKLMDAEKIKRINASAYSDTKVLAKELIRAGLLTSFQAKAILQGKAKDLLIGPYIVTDLLGEGGMGQVYKAKHQKMDRMVALKLIHKDRVQNETALRRFRREILAASKLNHPNIVRAIDADEINGQLTFAMEFVEGCDLAKFVKEKGPLPVEEACNYIRQAAIGLQHAHEQGLVHRDIKPQNLLLSKTGVIKILDMGLARRMEQSEDTTTLTQEGTVVGTADYLPPEQAISSHTVDIRADIYSLGATLYYLLVGKVPFPGGTLTEKLIKCQMEEPIPIEQLKPNLPPYISIIVRRMMAKKAKDRYQTPAEVVAALDTSVTEVIKVVPKSNITKKVVIAISAVSVLMLVSCGLLFVFIPKKQVSAPVAQPVIVNRQIVYLSDLQEKVDLAHVGRWFGKNNKQIEWNGNVYENTVTFKGKKNKHDILMVPGVSPISINVFYTLDNYDRFACDVGLADGVLTKNQNLVFSVYGNGKLLWKSKIIAKAREIDSFDISVHGIKTLELRVESSIHADAQAIWSEPRLTK
jgi:serine/threonine protein kinase